MKAVYACSVHVTTDHVTTDTSALHVTIVQWETLQTEALISLLLSSGRDITFHCLLLQTGDTFTAHETSSYCPSQFAHLLSIGHLTFIPNLRMVTKLTRQCFPLQKIIVF